MDFSPPRKRAPLLLDLTPLIDVVFLLLIFFMVSTTFVQDDPAGLEIDLPRSDSDQVLQSGEDVSLRLTAEGAVFVGEDGVTLEGLRSALAAAARKDPDTLVVLEADVAVDHGRVVEVLDLARELGLTRFAIATEAPE